jgi:hypothetical protein
VGERGGFGGLRNARLRIAFLGGPGTGGSSRNGDCIFTAGCIRGFVTVD